MSNRPLVPIERLCKATVVGTDRRCSVAAIQGGTVCVYHGGSAGQVRQAARRRLASMVDPALATLAEVVTSSSDQVKLAAAKDILDRSGLAAVQETRSEITVSAMTRDELEARAAMILGELGDGTTPDD